MRNSFAVGAGPTLGDDPSPGVTRITWRDVPPGGGRRSSLRPFKAVLVAALLLGSAILIVSFVDPSELDIGGSTALSAPAIQQLTTAGETWSISDQQPVVLNFTSGAAGSIWMNFTLSGGGLGIFWCPANIVIKPLGFPPCDQRLGVDGGMGEFIAWGPGGQVQASEFAFINEGPNDGGNSTVVLTWTSPLTVLSGGCGATCPTGPPAG